MNDQQLFSAKVPLEHAGRRLDQVLAELFPQFSRSRLQGWIKRGYVSLDQQTCTAKQKVFGGECVSMQAVVETVHHDVAQDTDFEVVFEDPDFLVINKPVGLVVHPAAGHHDGTLMNGLLFRYPELKHLQRAGIIHRLDKDTSGLMVVARSMSAHHALTKQLQERRIGRRYRALVHGEMVAGGSVEAAIGRHPSVRIKMAVRADGKPALTHYRVKQRFKGFTCLDVALETGRTHQIRVHMSHIGYPIVGDPVYRGRLHWPKGTPSVVIAALRNFQRQALHAYAIELNHPGNGEPMQWQQALPNDMAELITLIGQTMS